MIDMSSNDDQYIAAVASYIRNDFGNSGSFVNPDYVAQIRANTSQKEDNYQYDALIAEIPKVLAPQDNWKVSASSTSLQGVGSTRDPSYVFGFKGWKTDGNQKNGSWFQVELPQPATLTEIFFETGNDQYPRKYKVSISKDGRQWTEVAERTGENGSLTTSWATNMKVKFLKIENLEDADKPWSMRKLSLFAR